MPAHNWRGIQDGIFHDLHATWVAILKTALNGGLLPEGYYAMAEQRNRNVGPDVLALEMDAAANGEPRAGTALMAPPQTTLKKSFEVLSYVNRQNSVVIHTSTGDRIVAVVEIVSRGNKTGRANFQMFMDKTNQCLKSGIHFTYADIYPPGTLDPYGIHGALCLQNGDDPPELAPGKVLSSAGYEAEAVVSAYVNSFGIGDVIPDTPIFLKYGLHVMLPLERTYIEAFATLPRHLRMQIELNTNRVDALKGN